MLFRNASDGRTPAIRYLHLMLIATMTLAFAAGGIAFNFDVQMPIRLRDTLFNIHRLAGVFCVCLVVTWGCLVLARSLRSGIRMKMPTALGAYHVFLLVLAFLVPCLPWIARALDGRWEELYVLISPYNLVSHPTNDLTYWLLDKHKLLVELLAYLLLGHIAGALYHAVVLKDGVWRGMLSRSEPPRRD